MKSMLIAGVDEAGRGCLAGPVMAAAVIFPTNFLFPFEVKDSKQLTPKKREALEVLIKEHAVAWAIGSANVQEIEAINILQASLLAMERAVDQLSVKPEYIYVDGNQAPKWHYQTQAIIKGDETIPSIMAASILAKVARDREMIALGLEYTGYGFEKHKGYGTTEHVEALRKLGVTPLHRRHFHPVSTLLNSE